MERTTSTTAGPPVGRPGPLQRGMQMVALMLFLLLVAILFGVGSAVHALFWVALIALALWLVGFVAHPGGSRWYYW